MAWRIRPAGSGFSTAPDMLRLLLALQECTLLSCAMVSELTSPQIDIAAPPGVGMKRSYGYTFDISEAPNGVRSVGHSGGAPGISTVAQYYPQLGYTVVILSNYDRAAWWVNMRVRELIGAV